MSRIRVTIDHVVLRGIQPAERQAILDGLREELQTVLSDPVARAAWSRSHHAPVLRLGQMTLVPGPTGGRTFARGLIRALGRRIGP